MWTELNLEQMACEQNAGSGVRPIEEVEQMVVMVRLELYNRGLPCGSKALRRRLDEHYALNPLPSERSIARMLSRNGLTHGRTGWYASDEPQDIPESARRPGRDYGGYHHNGRLEIATCRRSSKAVSDATRPRTVDGAHSAYTARRTRQSSQP
jgi:hypothetical protein